MGSVFKYGDDVQDAEEEKDKNDETSSEEFDIDASHVEKQSGNSDSSVETSTNVSGGSRGSGSFGTSS